MQKHDHYEELCALAALGQLSQEEYETLSAHVETCGNCRDSVEKFSLVLTHLPDEQAESSDQQMTELHEASYRDRFLSKAERKGFRFSENVRAGRTQARPWNILYRWMHAGTPLWIPLTAAAALLLVSAVSLKSRITPVLNLAAHRQTPATSNVPATTATAPTKSNETRTEQVHPPPD